MTDPTDPTVPDPSLPTGPAPPQVINDDDIHVYIATWAASVMDSTGADYATLQWQTGLYEYPSDLDALTRAIHASWQAMLDRGDSVPQLLAIQAQQQITQQQPAP